MLGDVINYFDIPVHVDLNVMTANQTLSSLTTTLLEKIGGTIGDALPDCVIAQGDTTTVMVAAMTAFYTKIPLCHVEAGLRTYDLQSPWPEEFNRRVAGLCASLHFAPTQKSVSAAVKEGVPKKDVYLSGNTVIDSLLWARERSARRIHHGKKNMNSSKTTNDSGNRSSKGELWTRLSKYLCRPSKISRSLPEYTVCLSCSL